MEVGRNQQSFIVTTSDMVIAGPNMRRKTLLISSPTSGILFVNFARPASTTDGIAIPANTSPKTFTEDRYGKAIREDVHAILSAGSSPVGVMDIFELDL